MSRIMTGRACPGPLHAPPLRLAALLLSLLWGCVHAPSGNPSGNTPPPAERQDAPDRPAPAPVSKEPLPLRTEVSAALTRVFTLPAAQVSNPSGLAFGGRTPSGLIQLYTVCDGSAIVKDKLDPHQVVLSLQVDPAGLLPPKLEPLPLDDGAVGCDLEAIEVDPTDGTLWIADERVAGLPACGGTGPAGRAFSRIVHISRTGKLLDGPFEVEVPNTDNNGIEGMAAFKRDQETRLLLFKEWSEWSTPPILEYRVLPGQSPELMARYHLDRPANATQSGADIRVADGILQVLDRDMMELVEVKLSSLKEGAHLPVHRIVSLRRLLELKCGIICQVLPERRRGMVEGIASDDQGGTWIILDNNGDTFPEGDRAPRLLYLPRGAF